MRKIGSVPIFLAVVGCAAPEVPGTYEAVVPAVGDAGQRHIRVTLRPDGAAAVTSAFMDKPNRFLAEGKWSEQGNRVAVTLDDGNVLVFRHAGHQLQAREWDRSRWGERGPGTLFRVR